ncbi:nitrilase family protein [Streptomyces cucumeris]|uniref:nitrilase family protein n=1 Tax=Streptomyces cucumeris TaxID=2962890 RepID=UPI003D749E80
MMTPAALPAPDGYVGSLRVTSVQFESRPADTAYNLGRVEAFARTAAAEGSRLVVFPEMCLLGYWHLTKLPDRRLHELAQTADGPLVRHVSMLSQEIGVGIGAGFLEADDEGRLFNSYAVCLPDGTVHVHRKLHAFEHEAISSGNRYTVFDTPWGARMGVLICWDNNLVENVRATALLGADILIAPHQTGGTNSRSPQGMKTIPLHLWEDRQRNREAIEKEFQGRNGRGWLMRWLPSRAHDNGIFLIFSNGVGQDDDEVRTGNAMIIDPYGRILAETWQAEDAAVTADLDLSLLPLSTGQRWIKGRRPELYAILTRRFGDERSPREARFSTTPTAPPARTHGADDDPRQGPSAPPTHS